MIENKNIEQLMRPIGLMRLIGPMGLMGLRGLMGLMGIILSLSLMFSAAPAAAQVIGGHVYGGGNQGNVNGKTTVHVVAGDIDRVFGGARMANVGGRTFVHIDGENAVTDSTILISQIYGGNDIAGTIGTSDEELPAELTHVKRVPADDDDPEKNDVDRSWNSLVRLTSPAASSEVDDVSGKTTNNAVFIGTLYAAGNGNYDYEAPDEEDARHRIYEDGKLIAFSDQPFILPELNKTYLELLGGSICNAFGGGNNATVNEKTVIYVENRSAVVSSVKYNGFEKLNDARTKQMGYNTGFTDAHAPEFQVGMLFGGNNRAEMHIRPTWNLQAGLIRNLFSGANRGAMTSPEGLLLDINPTETNAPDLIVDNVYGGCRMGDVMPTVNGVYTPTTNLPGYSFPNELSARVVVRAGDINNIYGGNDITGTVYGGNAIGIRTSIRGNVYGGGNGGYFYTDVLEDDPIYGDFYYTTDEEHTTSISALNAFRPNAEQVSIRLWGKDPMHPTIVHGAIYLGGNCASLDTKKANPMVELKIGSYVIADNVFLGNNGQKMIDEDILELYANNAYSSLNLTDKSVFANYMEGVCMDLQPSVVFDSEAEGDLDTYEPYSSYIGSFYCGGNVGSMGIPGKNVYSITQGLNIYNKFVGGCNQSYVAPRAGLNAGYQGGVLGAADERGGNPDEYYTDNGTETGNIKDRLEINLSNLVMNPLRWDDTNSYLIWNTQKWDYGYTKYDVGEELAIGTDYYTYTPYTAHTVEDSPYTVQAGDNYYEYVADKYSKITASTVLPVGATYYTYTANHYTKHTVSGAALTTDGSQYEKGDELCFVDVPNDPIDSDTRLMGANVYGGCYDSGIVNGNIVININETVLKKDEVFGNAVRGDGHRASGVELLDQRDDVLAVALTAFGAGCGEDTEVWGSTTVNLNKGYLLQIFGGGEEGLVGKKEMNSDLTPKVDGEGNYVYEYDPRYSTTVNLNGATPIYSSEDSSPDLAETEYIYAGGSEGDVCGNTTVNLGNGRIYDAFAGSSNADILGHTEAYIGRQPDGSGGFKNGFPWIRDNVYGGNDFGGTVWGSKDFSDQTTRDASVEDVSLLAASAYVRYIQGRVDTIVGGNYGGYDYSDRIYSDYTNADGTPKAGFSFPHLKDNSFMHFQPINNSRNFVSNIFAGSEGYEGAHNSNNSMQSEAYALIDDTESNDENRFANVDVYGGGSYAGVGTYEVEGAGRTVVDLFAGKIKDVYGGCNREGLVGYTRVNVPAESTIKVNALFGGGKGYSNEEIASNAYLATRLCDHYVTCVNYQSADAIVEDAIYGGNQNSRIACDTYVNIEAPVMQSNGYQATIYGAGYGRNTVCGRTNIFMNDGSNAYKVFGGGRDGNVFNYASLAKWMASEYAGVVPPEQIPARLTVYRGILDKFAEYLEENPITLPDHTGTYPVSPGVYDGTYTNDILPSSSDPLFKTSYYNTNVHIMEGGNVSGYAYGGGYGSDAIVGGTTYIELLGGNVDKDIYGGGQGGHVYDEHNLGSAVFTPSTNVYIEGGMCRNAYGGGYLGHVGYHDGGLADNPEGDRKAIANVVVGKAGATEFTDGVPAIMRNVYGGGEGGSVYGTTNVTVNNGYIGYRYKNTGTELAPKYEYVEELDDQKPGDLDLSGNIFGGGYVINSYVDIANVNMYGGTVRGSLYGGGEIGPIGRGTVQTVLKPAWACVNGDATIYKAGQTHVKMFNGHVLRNVFGGGRGKDSWGGDGTMYMDKDLVATLDMNVKGYIFGQTDVNIYGGEIGTEEAILAGLGYGNVFGGGDEGSVYSAYELQKNYTQAEIDAASPGDPAYGKTTSDTKPVLYVGKKYGERYDDVNEGHYFKSNGTNPVDNNGDVLDPSAEKFLTEDCHVLVEPWLQVRYPVNYNDHTYDTGDYIPTSYLNTLPKKDKSVDYWPAEWNAVDAGSVVDGKYVERGITIHNAVFAGGNIAVGSELNANTKTVFGNASASIHDVYSRDLITIGTGHTGGLYGDGNLTLVDGYRELNITNYGTDYYNIREEITYEKFLELPFRESAYYELKYRCKKSCTDVEGTTYKVGSQLPQDELTVLFAGQKDGGVDIIQADGKPNPDYWTQNGVVSRYAGRILNTIQRADFCGVFGSRMVMKGAKDRVPEVADNTKYTINRVREVSLNKKASSAGDVGEFATHGNYFGIYSVVNYLGALTSDLDFHDAVRVTDNADAKYHEKAKGKDYGVATYEEWKDQWHKDPRRNNGVSHNQVALASGVYLELTTEKSTGKTLETKDWGIIMGVVQLDLINVSKGLGGGFVYAKNIHGVRESTSRNNTLLSDLNKTGGPSGVPAVTNKKWKYIETDAGATSTQKEWQTSGNFIHNTQVIIDDCYNISGRYQMGNRVPAHYWYIRGTVYVYDQYITAHTGSTSAYSKTVELPITISAASHNKMTLMDVQPNLYAFYSSYTSAESNTRLKAGQKLIIGEDTYYLNDPINYWDWFMLPASEKLLFVSDTYIANADCEVGTGGTKVSVESGTVLLPDEYEALLEKAVEKDVTPDDSDPTEVPSVVVNERDVAFSDVFHSSNNMSHDTGYLLTYEMTNPGVWSTWYTEASDNAHDSSVAREKQQTREAGYEDGPTYHLTETGGKVLGQHPYEKSSIIPEKTYNDYTTLKANHSSAIPSGQAEFVAAHVVTREYMSESHHYYVGAPVSATEALGMAGFTEPAYVCTATIQLSPTEFIYVNQLMTEDEKDAYIAGASTSDLADEIDALIVPAYYCTKAGLYGGNYYESGKNYRALEAYSAMSPEDRAQFTFNYDAFDLLIDPDYSRSQGQKYQYDGEGFTTAEQAKTNPATYSLATPLDYTATYDGTTLAVSNAITVTRGGVKTDGVTEIQTDDVLDRETFESLPNEQYHYSPIDVTAGNVDKTYYVVNTDFYYKEPFTVGQVIDKETFDGLPNDPAKEDLTTNITQLQFNGEGEGVGIYYYCRQSYEIEAVGEYGEGEVTGIKDDTDTYGEGDIVPVGLVISSGDYDKLRNVQKNFTIHGISPMETSTLFVSRDADYDDLSSEKIITVIYQYDYEESDESGAHITPISERHVVRIHITFESGVPIVEDIQEPDIVLPGTSITMRVPGITPGAYEIIGGGWKLFETKQYAESHINGVPYTPSVDSLYWYQDDFYLAYYAKTMLGETYSNAVPVHVANYHDLKGVMDDKKYHLHVDYDRNRLKRDSKIYINDYSGSSQNGLDLFRDFYDLSLVGESGGSGYTVTDGVITAVSTGNNTHLLDHAVMNISELEGTSIYDGEHYTKGVKGATNLEFFFRADIEHEDDPAVANEWKPIGTDDQCFHGTVHGDGHTISGLDNSLFYNLCGDVYNLGVTGSYNTAGVADKGTGYVESAWVKTSSTTPGSRPYPVFGAPNRNVADSYQVVNSYYYTGNKDLYTTMEGDAEIDYVNHSKGSVTSKPEKAFYDGELAYELNNFYLYKRYNDQKTTSGTDAQKYNYYTIDDMGDLELHKDHYYDSQIRFCSSGYEGLKYVEDRFADGDFRYAAGEIPESEDERYHVETVTDPGTGEETIVSTGFYPIYPDDYIFFGQKLTYGYNTHPHQDVPTAVARDGGRLAQNSTANRVYRAPAYYRNKTMGVAHFNPTVYLAQKSSDGTKTAYPGMTAIDFAGHQEGHAKSAYKLGLQDGWFYSPLLDDDGLLSINNCDETQNLLAYAPAASGDGYVNAKTHGVLTSYFVDPSYDDYYDDSDGYRLVAECSDVVNGHLVQSDLTAINDHFLVDKQEFNCPIAYDFASTEEDDVVKHHRMWYQRRPDDAEYVSNTTTGWQGISLPFTAELVTTHQKGEITHFFSGSATSANSDKKIGHEYWLREFNTINIPESNDVATAYMQYPNATGSEPKVVTSHFLWDYYYKNEPVHNQLDKNADTYLQYRQYYSTDRRYDSYPLLTAAMPYLLGLPGELYYEFDLSGNFAAANTATAIDQLTKQIVTFASKEETHIAVSDDEIADVLTNKTTKASDNKTGTKSITFAFKPTYLKQTLEADDYALNAAGSQFDKVGAGSVTTVPFRPYFTATVAGETKRYMPTRILFSGVDSGEDEGPESALDGSIEIFVSGRNIVTRSHMAEPTTIRILNIGGVTVTNFVLEPGQTIETPVQAHGAYIVNKKKVFVR